MFDLSAKPTKEIQMSGFPNYIRNGVTLVQPTSYNRCTLDTDSLTVTIKGVSHLINGTVTVYMGKRGVTFQGYDTKTGRYTKTIKHVKGEVIINSAIVNGVTVPFDKRLVG
jgi:hypothetical protein